MKTEELIVALAGAAGPVHRLPRPAIRLWRWAIVTAGVAAIAILTFGWRADLVDVLGQPAFLGLVITAVGATGLAATAAFHLSVPGAERSRLPRRLAWLAVAAWLVMNAIGLMAGAEHPARGVRETAIHAACVARVAAIALVPGVVLVVMLGRAAPVDAGATSALGALAAGSAALATIQFICPIAGATHALGSHFAPALSFFVIAAVAGKGRMTAWQARPPRASSGPDAA